MPKPLRSDDPNPQPVQFSHFGVLNDGTRSKGATVSAIVINCTIAALILILGMVVKSNPIVAKKLTELTLPPEPKVQPAPKPPPPPPPPKIKMPPPPKIETPKIKMPEPVKVPEIKPVALPPTPKPMIEQPAPKKVTPPPAPVKVNLGTAMAASVPNHDANPTAVRLGQSTNPLKPLTGPAVSPVNMGAAGMPGMNASNTGNGPRAVSVNMGSGSPNGKMGGRDNAVRAVAGLGTGVTGGTGHAPAGPVAVAIQPPMQQQQAARPQVQQSTLASAPKVTYKPTPVYTEEAKAMHLEGNVSLRIRVTANGAVQVLGVVHGLGHGLDQSAIQATEATRFKPALDQSGHAIDWEGVVLVNFQMS
jgi:periplasmic protein TonB